MTHNGSSKRAEHVSSGSGNIEISATSQVPSISFADVSREHHQYLRRRVCLQPACEEFGESRLTSVFQSGWSSPTLKAALAGKGLPSSIIEAALKRAAAIKPMYPSLDLDESAALVLFASHDLPCVAINDALRHDDYILHLSPWFEYIRVLLNAMSKLPPCPVQAVMHGCSVSATELNISVAPGSEFTFASFTSASTHGSTSFVKHFMNEEAHTVWRLELPQHIGRDIRDFALQPTSEGEVLLPPGVTFEVLSTCSTPTGLVVACRQSESETLLDLMAKVCPPSLPVTAAAPPPERALFSSESDAPTTSPTPSSALTLQFSDEALASVQLSHALIERYRRGEECGFWFVKADAIRALKKPVLLKMQRIRRESPSWLVHQTIRFIDLCAGAYRFNYLVVSHRWEAPDDPDGMGVQAAALQQHLLQHPDIHFVWIDVRV